MSFEFAEGLGLGYVSGIVCPFVGLIGLASVASEMPPSKQKGAFIGHLLGAATYPVVIGYGIRKGYRRLYSKFLTSSK